jgi:hypothetical protein
VKVKADLSIIEPWDFLRQSLPGDSSQNGIVCPSWICDVDLSVLDCDLTLSFDEISIELRGVTGLEASEVLSQSAVEGVGDHRHDDVEMDFDQDGRGECIEVEEFHRLRDALLDTPAAGIASDNELHRGFLIVGDDECRLFPSIATHEDLTNFAIVVAQGDCGFIDQRILVFALLVGNGDPLPGAGMSREAHVRIS